MQRLLKIYWNDQKLTKGKIIQMINLHKTEQVLQLQDEFPTAASVASVLGTFQ